MRLTFDYQKKKIKLPGQSEKVTSHQIKITAPNGMVLIAASPSIAESWAGAVELIQTEFIDKVGTQ